MKPQNGGLHDGCRIIYESAPGERVVIAGSERITEWMPVSENVWKVCLDNSFFGEFNPYKEPIKGDWIVGPIDYDAHTGEIYLNGKSLYEAASLEQIYHPKVRYVSPHETWGRREEKIKEPERTVYQWFSEVDDEKTVIYANLPGMCVMLTAEVKTA